MDIFTKFSITIVLSTCAFIVLQLLCARALDTQRLLVWGQRLSRQYADRAFAFLAIVYMFVFGILAAARYLTFHTGYTQNDSPVYTSWDLGQYTQLVWNSLNGRLLENSYILDAPLFLGKSFTPILLALVPLYAVWSSPIVLLVVQTMGLGLSAFPIYWFARARIGRALAVVLGLAYLLSPGLENIGLSEFHEIAFSTPLIAYATFFLLRRHYQGFLVCLALALLVKEEIAFITIIFGVYIFFVQRNRWLGLALAFSGAVWAVLLLQYIIPFFRGGQFGSTFYYFGQGMIGGGGTRYGYLGQNLPEILATFVTRPEVVFNAVWTPAKIEYVLHFLVPLMFVPLVGIEVFALALPTFGYSVLSNYHLQTSIRSYYFAPLLPFVFFAAAIGLQRILRVASQNHNRAAWQISLGAMLLVSSGINCFFQAPGPLGQYSESERYVWNEHTALGNKLVHLIPDDGLVVAQNEYLARLSNRQQIYEIPIPDYRQVDYLFADTTQVWYKVHQGFWETYLSSGYFETVAQRDGYLVAKRRSPAQRLNIQFDGQMTVVGYTMVTTNTLPWGMTLRPVVEWRADRPIAEAYRIAISVVDQQGHVWVTEEREPQDGLAPTNRWQVGKSIGDQYTIRLPPTMPTRDYRITAAVRPIGEGEELQAWDEQGNALGTRPTIGSVRIEKNKGSFIASDLWWIEEPLYVDMQEMRFLGFAIPRKTIRSGELLPVGLYWRARGKPQGDYVVVVQLRDANGCVALEQSARPANGTYPTTQWDVGEVLLDWHDLVLPGGMAEGKYEVFVLLRDLNTEEVLGETRLDAVTSIH